MARGRDRLRPRGAVVRQLRRAVRGRRGHRRRRSPARRRPLGGDAVLVDVAPGNGRRTHVAPPHGRRHARLERGPGLLVVVPDLLGYPVALTIGRRHRLPHHAGAGASGPVGARYRAATPLRTGGPPRPSGVLARRRHRRRLAVHPYVGHGTGGRRPRRVPQRPGTGRRDRLPPDRSHPRGHRRAADRDRAGSAPTPAPAVAVGLGPGGHLGIRQHLRLPGQQRRGRDAAAHERRVHRRTAAHRRGGLDNHGWVADGPAPTSTASPSIAPTCCCPTPWSR